MARRKTLDLSAWQIEALIAALRTERFGLIEERSKEHLMRMLEECKGVRILLH